LAWAAVQNARTAARRHEEQTKADRQRRITESFSKATEQLASGLSRIFRGQHPQPARAAGLLPGSGGIPRLRRQPCLRVVLNKVTGRRRGFPPTPEGRSAKRPMAEQLGFEPLVPAENELLFLAGTGTPEWRRGRPRRRRLPGPGVRIVLAPQRASFCGSIFAMAGQSAAFRPKVSLGSALGGDVATDDTSRKPLASPGTGVSPGGKQQSRLPALWF